MVYTPKVGDFYQKGPNGTFVKVQPFGAPKPTNGGFYNGIPCWNEAANATCAQAAIDANNKIHGG